MDEADAPVSEKNTGAVDVAVSPMMISAVEVVFRTTSVDALYVQLLSPVTLDGQFVPFARQTDWPATVSEFNKREEPEAEVNARFVVVAFVPVEFVNVSPCNDVVPVAVMFDAVRPP